MAPPTSYDLYRQFLREFLLATGLKEQLLWNDKKNQVLDQGRLLEKLMIPSPTKDSVLTTMPALSDPGGGKPPRNQSFQDCLSIFFSLLFVADNQGHSADWQVQEIVYSNHGTPLPPFLILMNMNQDLLNKAEKSGQLQISLDLRTIRDQLTVLQTAVLEARQIIRRFNYAVVKQLDMQTLTNVKRLMGVIFEYNSFHQLEKAVSFIAGKDVFVQALAKLNVHYKIADMKYSALQDEKAISKKRTKDETNQLNQDLAMAWAKKERVKYDQLKRLRLDSNLTNWDEIGVYRYMLQLQRSDQPLERLLFGKYYGTDPFVPIPLTQLMTMSTNNSWLQSKVNTIASINPKFQTKEFKELWRVVRESNKDLRLTTDDGESVDIPGKYGLNAAVVNLAIWTAASKTSDLLIAAQAFLLFGQLWPSAGFSSSTFSEKVRLNVVEDLSDLDKFKAALHSDTPDAAFQSQFRPPTFVARSSRFPSLELKPYETEKSGARSQIVEFSINVSKDVRKNVNKTVKRVNISDFTDEEARLQRYLETRMQNELENQRSSALRLTLYNQLLKPSGLWPLLYRRLGHIEFAIGVMRALPQILALRIETYTETENILTSSLGGHFSVISETIKSIDTWADGMNHCRQFASVFVKIAKQQWIPKLNTSTNPTEQLVILFRLQQLAKLNQQINTAGSTFRKFLGLFADCMRVTPIRTMHEKLFELWIQLKKFLLAPVVFNTNQMVLYCFGVYKEPLFLFSVQSEVTLRLFYAMDTFPYENDKRDQKFSAETIMLSNPLKWARIAAAAVQTKIDRARAASITLATKTAGENARRRSFQVTKKTQPTLETLNWDQLHKIRVCCEAIENVYQSTLKSNPFEEEENASAAVLEKQKKSALMVMSSLNNLFIHFQKATDAVSPPGEVEGLKAYQLQLETLARKPADLPTFEMPTADSTGISSSVFEMAVAAATYATVTIDSQTGTVLDVQPNASLPEAFYAPPMLQSAEDSDDEKDEVAPLDEDLDKIDEKIEREPTHVSSSESESDYSVHADTGDEDAPELSEEQIEMQAKADEIAVEEALKAAAEEDSDSDFDAPAQTGNVSASEDLNSADDEQHSEADGNQSDDSKSEDAEDKPDSSKVNEEKIENDAVDETHPPSEVDSESDSDSNADADADSNADSEQDDQSQSEIEEEPEAVQNSSQPEIKEEPEAVQNNSQSETEEEAELDLPEWVVREGFPIRLELLRLFTVAGEQDHMVGELRKNYLAHGDTDSTPTPLKRSTKRQQPSSSITLQVWTDVVDQTIQNLETKYLKYGTRTALLKASASAYRVKLINQYDATMSIDEVRKLAAELTTADMLTGAKGISSPNKTQRTASKMQTHRTGAPMELGSWNEELQSWALAVQQPLLDAKILHIGSVVLAAFRLNQEPDVFPLICELFYPVDYVTPQLAQDKFEKLLRGWQNTMKRNGIDNFSIAKVVEHLVTVRIELQALDEDLLNRLKESNLKATEAAAIKARPFDQAQIVQSISRSIPKFRFVDAVKAERVAIDLWTTLFGLPETELTVQFKNQVRSWLSTAGDRTADLVEILKIDEENDNKLVTYARLDAFVETLKETFANVPTPNSAKKRKANGSQTPTPTPLPAEIPATVQAVVAQLQGKTSKWQDPNKRSVPNTKFKASMWQFLNQSGDFTQQFTNDLNRTLTLDNPTPQDWQKVVLKYYKPKQSTNSRMRGGRIPQHTGPWHKHSWPPVLGSPF